MESREVRDGKLAYFINDETKQVRATQALFAGTVGSGKSTAANHLAHTYKWDAHATVIYVTEKPEGGALENAFCAFPPQNEQHKEFAVPFWKRAGKEVRAEPVKIYHPFTFGEKGNTPFGRHLPPIHWFTFNIKRLDETALAALFASDLDSNTVNMVLTQINRLEDDEGIFDLGYRVTESFEEEQKKGGKVGMDELGMPVGDIGDQTTVERFKNFLKLLVTDYFVQPANCQHNINMVDVLNDNEHTHFFTTKFIKDSRLRYFFYIQLLREISKAIGTGEVTHHVVLVLEEIKVLIPLNPKASYQAQLANALIKMLSILRNQGRGVTTIATTQSYYQTNKEFRSANDDLFLFKMNIEDKRRWFQEFMPDKDTRNLIEAMPTKVFFNKNEMRPDNYPIMYCCPQSPFARKEEGDPDFFAKWREVYPEQTRTYGDLAAQFREWRDNSFKLVKEKHEVLQKKATEKQRKKEDDVDMSSKLQVMEQRLKDEVTILKVQVQEKKRSEEEMQIITLCNIARENPDASWLSIFKLGQKFGLGINSVMTVQRYTFKGLYASQEYDLIKHKFTKAFVRKNFREKYQGLYGISPEGEEEIAETDVN